MNFFDIYASYISGPHALLDIWSLGPIQESQHCFHTKADMRLGMASLNGHFPDVIKPFSKLETSKCQKTQ